MFFFTNNLVPSKPVSLVGLMGSGKSSVGWRLAKRLNIPFVDSDQQVEEAAGCSVRDIYELWGEKVFKEAESTAISRLVQEDTIRVISTGDGAFVQPHLRALMLEKTICIWLKADFKTLYERVKNRPRPQLCDGDPSEILHNLYEERSAIYAEAHLTIDSCDDVHDKTVDRIMGALQSYLVPASSTLAPSPGAPPFTAG